jgi:predicted metal-dependent hydrolase
MPSMNQPGIRDQPNCLDNIHPEALHGIQLFNQQHFFEAHEALEYAWKEEKGPVRDLYRGILQVAVGYYHLKRGNILGARKMFHRCAEWLEKYPEHCRGVDVARLIKDYRMIESQLDRLAQASPATLENLIFPPVSLTPKGERHGE